MKTLTITLANLRGKTINGQYCANCMIIANVLNLTPNCLKKIYTRMYCIVEIRVCAKILNTELAIYALDQVHCWGAYFRPGIGHYENFTSLNFQPLLLSKQ
jgi:hypothetical protein